MKDGINIFLTGATGFVGGELLVSLSKDPRVNKIYCLVRAKTPADAYRRITDAFDCHRDFFDPKLIVPVMADLSAEDLPHVLSGITDVDVVIHSAADTSFAPSHKKNIQKVNIVGASNVAKWAACLPNLETFMYVGTSWIRGCRDRNFIAHEDESPNLEQPQLVYYCQSKAIGETKVREIIPAEKLLVVRPSIIMGDSRPWKPRSDVISWAVAVFEAMRLVAMSGEAECDIIPVDYAVRAIMALLFNKNRRFDTYHISSGKKSATNMKLLLNAVSEDGRPPFEFVDHQLIKEMVSFSKGKPLSSTDALARYADYLKYWKDTFHVNGNGSTFLRKLLWAIDYYYQFVNLGIVFDNNRLMADTNIGPSEPAHVYMQRNVEQLRRIHVLDGEIDP